MAGTILLVEDEPSVGELVRGYLQKSGYRVVWVRSGEEAIAEVTGHDRELELRLQALRLFVRLLGTTLERTSLSEAERFSTTRS